MRIVKDYEKKAHQSSDSAIVYEYETVDQDIGGATAVINGRYPEHGYVVNLKIKQLVFVISGSGEIVLADKIQEICAGDVIFIDSGEKFAWNGEMSLFLANVPRFDQSQYREIA